MLTKGAGPLDFYSCHSTLSLVCFLSHVDLIKIIASFTPLEMHLIQYWVQGMSFYYSMVLF